MRWFIFLLACPLWSFVDQNNDVQLWITDSTVVGKGRYHFHLTNEWRIGDDISKWYFTYLEGLLKIQCTDRFDLEPGYRQVWRLRQEKWRLGYEPMINLFFHHRKVFQLRNRVTYVIREKDANFWQERFRIRLQSDYWKYNPYFSNEIFVRSHDGFYENRTQVGVNVPLWHQASSDLYYMLRFREAAKVWTHQHIFGLWLHMKF